MQIRKFSALTLTVTAIALAATGCGSSSSTATTNTSTTNTSTTTASTGTSASTGKPAYCGKVAELQQDLSGLSLSGGLSAAQAKLEKVETTASSLVETAKGDLQPQAQAIQTALDKLKTEVVSIKSSPSVSQIAAAGGAVKDLGTAVEKFVTATKSKCD